MNMRFIYTRPQTSGCWNIQTQKKTISRNYLCQSQIGQPVLDCSCHRLQHSQYDNSTKRHTCPTHACIFSTLLHVPTGSLPSRSTLGMGLSMHDALTGMTVHVDLRTSADCTVYTHHCTYCDVGLSHIRHVTLTGGKKTSALSRKWCHFGHFGG